MTPNLDRPRGSLPGSPSGGRGHWLCMDQPVGEKTWGPPLACGVLWEPPGSPGQDPEKPPAGSGGAGTVTVSHGGRAISSRGSRAKASCSRPHPPDPQGAAWKRCSWDKTGETQAHQGSEGHRKPRPPAMSPQGSGCETLPGGLRDTHGVLEEFRALEPTASRQTQTLTHVRLIRQGHQWAEDRWTVWAAGRRLRNDGVLDTQLTDGDEDSSSRHGQGESHEPADRP